ncbi:MAG: hypothetical protein KIT27_10905, partial [Legionellales bacterium]|nr:hypothetical protein [Legionellales bacterium]
MQAASTMIEETQQKAIDELLHTNDFDTLWSDSTTKSLINKNSDLSVYKTLYQKLVLVTQTKTLRPEYCIKNDEYLDLIMTYVIPLLLGNINSDNTSASSQSASSSSQPNTSQPALTIEQIISLFTLQDVLGDTYAFFLTSGNLQLLCERLDSESLYTILKIQNKLGETPLLAMLKRNPDNIFTLFNGDLLEKLGSDNLFKLLNQVNDYENGTTLFMQFFVQGHHNFLITHHHLNSAQLYDLCYHRDNFGYTALDHYLLGGHTQDCKNHVQNFLNSGLWQQFSAEQQLSLLMRSRCFLLIYLESSPKDCVDLVKRLLEAAKKLEAASSSSSASATTASSSSESTAVSRYPLFDYRHEIDIEELDYETIAQFLLLGKLSSGYQPQDMSVFIYFLVKLDNTFIGKTPRLTTFYINPTLKSCLISLKDKMKECFTPRWFSDDRFYQFLTTYYSSERDTIISLVNQSYQNNETLLGQVVNTHRSKDANLSSKTATVNVINRWFVKHPPKKFIPLQLDLSESSSFTSSSANTSSNSSVTNSTNPELNNATATVENDASTLQINKMSAESISKKLLDLFKNPTKKDLFLTLFQKILNEASQESLYLILTRRIFLDDGSSRTFFSEIINDSSEFILKLIEDTNTNLKLKELYPDLMNKQNNLGQTELSQIKNIAVLAHIVAQLNDKDLYEILSKQNALGTTVFHQLLERFPREPAIGDILTTMLNRFNAQKQLSLLAIRNCEGISAIFRLAHGQFSDLCKKFTSMPLSLLKSSGSSDYEITISSSSSSSS